MVRRRSPVRFRTSAQMKTPRGDFSLPMEKANSFAFVRIEQSESCGLATDETGEKVLMSVAN